PEDVAPRNRPSGSRSVAQRFIDPDPFRRTMASGLIGADGSVFSSEAVEVLDRQSFAAWLASGEEHLAAPVDGAPAGPRDQRLLDMVSVRETDVETVKWVEEVVRNDAAAETARGDLLPEATYDLDLRSTTVKRIGHFVPAHEDQLADAAGLRGYLDNRLGTGV